MATDPAKNGSERFGLQSGEAPTPVVGASVSHDDAHVWACEARDGSKEAFTHLVGRYEAPLFQFLKLRSASREDAEELTQEAFLRAWQRIDTFDSRYRFSTWLFTLGKRLAVSRYRKRRHDALTPEAMDDLCSDSDPLQSAGAREESDQVWYLAGRVLTEEQRSALWLRYAEGLSTREIADVLERRETTVRVVLFRARQRLARHLVKQEAPARPKSAYPARHAAAQPATGGR